MKQDIFDKLIDLPILNIFKPFYKKHKEILLYLFFGVLTFIISVGSYSLFNVVFEINELVANLISWILAVMFAFFTNRIWVFEGKTEKIKDFFVQMANFFGGRILTLLIEEVILFVFITQMELRSVPVKVVAQVIVIMSNYIISKIWVFKKTV